jgi:hypothetical protein
MATPLGTENTHFSRDILGRYICNTFDEAQLTTDKGVRPDARQFDVIIIGGGSFGAALAQHVFNNDITKPQSERHRILILEAGLFALPEHVQNLPMPGTQQRRSWLGLLCRRSLRLLWRLVAATAGCGNAADT